MNTAAYEERVRNSQYILEHRNSKHEVLLEIETDKVTYRGKPYRSLSIYEKKKFENLFKLKDVTVRTKLRFV